MAEKKAITRKTNVYTFDGTDLLANTEEDFTSHNERTLKEERQQKIGEQVRRIQQNHSVRTRFLDRNGPLYLIRINNCKDKLLKQYKESKLKI